MLRGSSVDFRFGCAWKDCASEGPRLPAERKDGRRPLWGGTAAAQVSHHLWGRGPTGCHVVTIIADSRFPAAAEAGANAPRRKSGEAVSAGGTPMTSAIVISVLSSPFGGS